MDPPIGIDSDRGGRFVESPGQSEHVVAAKTGGGGWSPLKEDSLLSPAELTALKDRAPVETMRGRVEVVLLAGSTTLEEWPTPARQAA